MFYTDEDRRRQEPYFSRDRLTKASGLNVYAVIHVISRRARNIIAEAEKQGENTPTVAQALNMAIDQLFPYKEK